MPTSNPYLDICWMIRAQLPQVLRIEQESFPDGWAWREEEFLTALRQRNCIAMVAVNHLDKVVGFVVYELRPGCLNVLNLAVTPDCRRSAVATEIVNKLKGKLAPQRRRAITTIVSDNNLPAQLFFRSTGFRATQILHGHYVEPRRMDAIEFEYRVGVEPTPQRFTNRISKFVQD